MVRESGTQPIVRVMVEANDADLRDSCAEQLIAYLSMRHGARIHSKVDLTHALGD
jgi:phosphoglucosamine mutase